MLYKVAECHIALGRTGLASDLIGKALKLMHLTEQDRFSLLYQSVLVYKIHKKL